MRNREYWTKRFEQLEDAQMNKGAAYFSELENHYTRAAREVQKEINQWYARFAVNNEITLQEARKILRADELKEFKWSVKEYIKHGEENNISGQWAKQLENASARWHITRLDALKLQMQNHVEMLFGYEQDSVTRLMEKIYSDGYYHTAYELQKGFSIGYDLMKLDTRQIEKVISKPWAADGSNFSSRIWKQKTQLVSELHTELTQAIIRGQNPGKITDYIASRFKTSKSNAGRLVMTEAAFFASASTRDCFNDLGVERYEICATLDSHTSDTCQGLDGHVFKMSEYEVGVTAPPFHQWCRTTTVPYFDDEFELDTKRAARGVDGKTYYVDSSLKYPEWKKAFVDGGSKKNLKPLENTDKSSRMEANKGSTLGSEVQDVKERPILTLDEVVEQAKKYGDDLSKHSELIEYGNGDPISNYVNKQLGYDALPSVVSSDEFEKLSEGKQVLYRGVTDYRDISAKEMVEQFKRGPFYCGRGVYGNGTYTDYDKKVATYYAFDSGDTDNGEIMEMLLKDDARTVSFMDIFTEFEKTGIPKIIGETKEAYQDVIRNVGTYSAIKGYDAITLDGFENKNHVVILNRGKVIIKE